MQTNEPISTLFCGVSFIFMFIVSCSLPQGYGDGYVVRQAAS